MAENYEKIWSTALGELEVVISRANFVTWFKDTFIYDYKKAVFTIGVPTIFIENYLKKKYVKEIKNALQKQSREQIENIKFKVSSLPEKSKNIDVEKKVIHRAVDNSSSNSQAEEVVNNSKNDTLNEHYVFENFVVGKSNQLAHAAAKSVAEGSGKNYNPLYIYGDSGLGKTHLIQAIGFRTLEKKPKTKVLYVSCEDFTNDYIDSVQSGKAKDFKNRYRSIDLLLIDDIQFLAGKEGTQEEFFHTFNHLHQKNKQVVLTSDRAPKDIKSLEKRLQTRFEWGMVADIQTPDLETRCAIIQSKCAEREKILGEDVINFIAKNIKSNIRELEGALTKLFACCDLSGETPSLIVTEKILSEIIFRSQRRQVISAEKVLKSVQKFYHIPIDDLIGKKRNKEVIKPRHIVMYILYNVVGMSYPEIGKELGGKNHSTIMHGSKAIEKEVVISKQLKDEIDLLKESIFE